MIEEIFSDAGFVWQMKGWYGGATKNVIVFFEIFLFDFTISKVFENVAFEIFVMLFKIDFCGFAFFAIT